MAAILHLALKDLRILARDRLAIFWMLAFPLIFALFFGSLFGGDGGQRASMAVYVVDDADTEGSRALVSRLAASEALDVEAAALELAREGVRKGERVAYLRVRPGFSGSMSIFARGDDDPAPIELGVDPGRAAERGLLQGIVTQAVFAGMMGGEAGASQAEYERAREQIAAAEDLEFRERQALDSLMASLAEMDELGLAAPGGDEEGEGDGGMSFGAGMIEAVDVGRDRSGKPRSPFEVTFPSAMVWGLFGVITGFATNMVRERRAGTLLRLQVSPLSRAQIVAGKGLSCVLSCVMVGATLLAVGVVALGVRVADPLLLLAALLLASACFTGIMMIAAMVGETEAAVSGAIMMTIMPLAMIGGGMIPLIAMPEWMLTVGSISPFKWSIMAIEGAIWRDFTLADMLAPFAVLAGIAVALFGAGVLLFRRRYG